MPAGHEINSVHLRHGTSRHFPFAAGISGLPPEALGQLLPFGERCIFNGPIARLISDLAIHRDQLLRISASTGSPPVRSIHRVRPKPLCAIADSWSGWCGCRMCPYQMA